MDYDGKFELNGKIVKYYLNRAYYKVHQTKKFEENPKVNTFFKLFFENGETLDMPVYCYQEQLTTLKDDFVKGEYIKYLEQQKA